MAEHCHVIGKYLKKVCMMLPFYNASTVDLDHYCSKTIVHGHCIIYCRIKMIVLFSVRYQPVCCMGNAQS